TLKSPSYTKSVSWQHYPGIHPSVPDIIFQTRSYPVGGLHCSTVVN
ncbi:transposase, partial [Shigella flexneri]